MRERALEQRLVGIAYRLPIVGQLDFQVHPRLGARIVPRRAFREDVRRRIGSCHDAGNAKDLAGETLQAAHGRIIARDQVHRDVIIY
ncbi:hypothetical protein ACVWZ3_009906 [Bradyrhizobium sp. i1.3.6]